MQADGFGSNAQAARCASPTDGPPWQLQVCEVVNRDGSRFPEVTPQFRLEASRTGQELRASCVSALDPLFVDAREPSLSLL